MLRLSSKECKATNKALDYWHANNLIDAETSAKLRNSYIKANFDWLKLSRYAFWISLCCIIVAIVSFFESDLFSKIFSALHHAAPTVIIAINLLLAIIFYAGALKLRTKYPERPLRNESIVFIGALFTAAAIYLSGKFFLINNQNISTLILISTLIYGLLALWFPSTLLWIFALLLLGGWFGAETGYVSGYGAYYLGMNYPLRFVLFGVALVSTSIIFKNLRQIPQLQTFKHTTHIIGMLYLFIALWILSIWGNYGSINDWSLVKQVELLHWSILFAIAALAAIYYGIKYEDGVAKGFGLVFIFINLYTRFFEFFWNESNKALFFIILGISFWLLGSKAEKIVNSLQLKIKTKQK